jgi:hypothetical protein
MLHTAISQAQLHLTLQNEAGKFHGFAVSVHRGKYGKRHDYRNVYFEVHMITIRQTDTGWLRELEVKFFDSRVQNRQTTPLQAVNERHAWMVKKFGCVFSRFG